MTTQCPNFPRCHCPQRGTVSLPELSQARKRVDSRPFWKRYEWVRAFRSRELRLIDIAEQEGISFVRVYQVIIQTEDEIKKVCK